MSYRDIVLLNTVTILIQSILLLRLIIKDGKNDKNVDAETEKKVRHYQKAEEKRESKV